MDTGRGGGPREPHSAFYVWLPFEDLLGRSLRLQDRRSPAVYDRSGDDVLARWFYLDMPGWVYHVFEMGRSDLVD